MGEEVEGGRVGGGADRGGGEGWRIWCGGKDRGGGEALVVGVDGGWGGLCGGGWEGGGGGGYGS